MIPSTAIKESAVRESRALRLRGIALGRVLTGPQTVHIDLANGCNTNCITCWDHSPLLNTARSSAWKRKRVAFEDFRALAEDLATMSSVEAVILSGMGDPFVNPDIYRIIEVSKQYGWHVTVLTNALLADAERVVELDVDMLLISVNGVSARSYVAFHPNLTAQDFARLKGLLATFAGCGKRFKHVQVINRDTAPEVPEMVRFAARYNAAHITYKLASLGHGTERCAITEQQRRLLIEEWIPEALSEAARLEVQTNLDVFTSQVETGGLATAPVKAVGCFMGWTYARVTVEGKILFCCSTEVEVGDLGRGKFSEQWFGAAWNETRARLMQGRYFAACAQCGKLNQNVKIGRRVREKLGEHVYLARTGRLHQPRDKERDA
ncbi:MAG TPA: radical SAM protein [Pyrinomonadaceae bacterium]|jgi:MoaA/NifB/PqqE/SkfB family radical SAM enzyme